MTDDPGAALRRELALAALASHWPELSYVDWSRLVGHALAADAVDELFAMPAVAAPGAHRSTLHNLLLNSGTQAGRRWAELLRSAPSVQGGLWCAAARLGWSDRAVARLYEAERAPDDPPERFDLPWSDPVPVPDEHLLLMHPAVNAICAVSAPDGRALLASAGRDGAVLFWDPATGAPLDIVLTGHIGAVQALCPVAVPDGRVLLASAGRDSTIRLWDPAAGEPVGAPLTGHAAPVVAVCALSASADRVLLASAGGDGAVLFWDPATGQPVTPAAGEALRPVAATRPIALVDWRPHTPYLHPNSDAAALPTRTPVWAACTLPLDGGREALAVGTNEGVWLYDTATGSPVGAAMGTDSVTALCAVPQRAGDMLLASASYRTLAVQCWDPATGEPVGAPLIGHAQRVIGLCAVPLHDGRTVLASADADGAIRAWPVPTARVTDVRRRRGGAQALCVLPRPDHDTLLAVGGGEPAVRLLDPTTGQPVGRSPVGHTATVRALCAVPLPDGRTLLASAGMDRAVRLWDPALGQPVGAPLTGYPDAVYTLCALSTPDGRTLLAAGGHKPCLAVWDLDNGRPVGEPIATPGGWVNVVCPVPIRDGRILLAAGGDRWLDVWDPLTRERIRTPLARHRGGASAMHVVPLPNGRTVLACGDDRSRVRLHEPAAKRPVERALVGHRAAITAISSVTLPDGWILLVTGDRDGVVCFWNMTTGVRRAVLRGSGAVNALAGLPDARLAIGTASGVTVVAVPDSVQR